MLGKAALRVLRLQIATTLTYRLVLLATPTIMTMPDMAMLDKSIGKLLAILWRFK